MIDYNIIAESRIEPLLLKKFGALTIREKMVMQETIKLLGDK